MKTQCGNGNMQKLLSDYTARGVVWVIVGSAGETSVSYLSRSKFGELANAKTSKATHLIAEAADMLFANPLDAELTGKEMVNAKNQPCGCGVKY